MTEEIESPRRAFLKGSLAIGAATVAVPALGQAADSTQQSRVGGTMPTQERAQAETGTIDTGEAAAAGSTEIVHNPGSDFMVDLLKATGIKYVTVTAGSSFRGFHESIVNYGGNKDPELIMCLHEEISAAFTHGYAKVAGKPIACLLHSTVGIQHASMAIYNAWCDRVPMIVLAGNGLDATKRRPGVEWFHTMTDLGGLLRDFVKWDDTPVSLPHYAESYMRALQVAMTPPYEPVMLVVDSDLQESGADRSKLIIPRAAPVAPPAADPVAIAKVAEWLVQAEAPVIAADRAARTATGMRGLVTLAEMLNASVVDRGGRMNMPTNHYLNQTGRQARLMKDADVILGLELTDIWGLVNNVPDKIERKSVRTANPEAKVVGISANYAFMHGNVQDMERFYSTDLALAADAETALPQLIEAVDRRLTRARRQQIAERKAGLEAAFRQTRSADATAAAIGWDASPISTARLSMELWNRLRNLDWGYVSNSAFVSSWPQRLWDITEHHQYIGGEGGYGVGYGAPAAAGAALAHRDAGRIAVSTTTDGELMMLPATLWTLAHHSIPLLMVMHNNRAWHQETMHLKRMANRRDRGPETWKLGTVIGDPDIDFATMARSMGVWSEGPIDQPDRLGPAIDRALEIVRSGKPALLDDVTQPR